MFKMPLRAYKTVVELNIHELSAPGIRLANKEDLYLNICLLGQQRRTRLVPSQFPLKFSDHLIFEKTFKFCRDVDDVVNFLADLHILIELIQLGRTQRNEVLAAYELNAKDFLYPTPDTRITYNSIKREIFMTRTNEFPGTISPQIIFAASVHIDETQTPSLDILKEYENRFVNDPLIDMRKKSANKKKSRRHRSDANNQKVPKKGILRHQNQENFANHTISSAIKADYTLPDVQFKLDELNSSVKKTRIVKTAPSVKQRVKKFSKPFVVRRVQDNLILRKPELHDVLHDGLVLTKKTSDRVGSSKRRRRSLSLTRLIEPVPMIDHASLHSQSLQASSQRPRARSARIQSRASRSLSPFSLNESLSKANERKSSRSVSSSSRNNRTYDILPENDSDENLSNCEVCIDSRSRSLNRESSRSANSSAVFSPVRKDSLNEAHLLHSEDFPHASFVRRYNSQSFKDAHELSNREAIKASKRNKHKYPFNQSFSHYAPPPREIDWQYARYYPWLFNYREYLRQLEDELHLLRVRSKYVNPI